MTVLKKGGGMTASGVAAGDAVARPPSPGARPPSARAASPAKVQAVKGGGSKRASSPAKQANKAVAPKSPKPPLQPKNANAEKATA